MLDFAKNILKIYKRTKPLFSQESQAIKDLKLGIKNAEKKNAEKKQEQEMSGSLINELHQIKSYRS